MGTSFCAIRQKNIINVVDGKNLGRAHDLLFDEDGCVKGLVVPGCSSSFWGMAKSDTIFIPWKRVCKIGDDVILVELDNNANFDIKSHDIDKNN